ncbi:hypothetical protein TGAM01_v203636 [Trichoderma gamsii]|uniref:Uncharacterized protein n=1 Tax=Trichoderma gamsii TaxID=398673 RepID=A0A2P4ZSH5_9HYPO|nr:hypothetical protein TGAM01_v203636 [Trichoderma gamsii]PON27255.1 hypothetical protein TGAM01_v203636 [Trichoderma gamsii]
MGFLGWLQSWQKRASASNQPQNRREPTSQPQKGPRPQPKKEPTYRVRGVPNDWDRDKLESFLVERDGPAGPVVQSLAKEFHGCSQTATVLFRNTCQLPLRISLPEPSGQFGELRNLALDHAFLGITTLFAPPQQDHKVDIIAICGLGGHAFGSFKERGGEHMWLRDALPHGITAESGQRIARIMVYGYESNIPDSDSFQNLEDLGTALHSDLRTLVFDGSFKPIVFIAHSLGGLVVKQFLISLSESKDEVDQKLGCAVYGLSFFGVPHDGMDIRSLIPMAGDGPNRFLLESIGSNNSQILSIQHREFSKALGGQGQSEIVSFYETRLSRTALKDEMGRWRMSGELAVLVTRASATHCRNWENGPEHICAINRTHSEMVKFAEEDPEYDKVLGRIKTLALRAITVRRSLLQRTLSQGEQNCLQSLAFEQMQDRGNDIDHAIQGTCEWLLKHDTYMKWATSHECLLWIKGKPGAGKSTLLKYAVSKQRDIPSAKDDDVVLSFFFHGRGNAIQKTPLGFLRSILHQALEKAPEAFPDLVDTYQQRCKVMGNPPENWQWHPEELWRFFELSLPQILANRSIWLFVDALDECGEDDARNLVQRFKALLKRISRLPSWIHFRVCFSCRHYPILSSRDLLEVCLEMENESDISTYVKSTLKLTSFEEPTRFKIRDLIISRASGVFLWTQLVVKKVQGLELDGDGPNKIEATIRSTPEGLHELYKELIKGMTSSSLRLIQWVCFAARPLSTEELRWAMVIDVRCPSLQECQKAYDYIPDSKRMDQQVIKLSRGLATVVPGFNMQVVQFIHQSVKDFFMDKGLVTLDNSLTSTDEAIGMAQFQLLKTCILYMKMEEISQSTSHGSGLKAELPFLHYAVTSWVSHLQKCDAIKFSPKNILELLSWPSNVILDLWVRLFIQLGRPSGPTPVAKTTLIHIAAEYRLVGVLAAILENNGQTYININSKDKHGKTPLSWAAQKGNVAVVKTLLDTGQAEINSTDIEGQTPLSRATRKGNVAVIKTLLDTGQVKIDSTDYGGRTPLSWAAEYGNEATVNILLNTGQVKVNSEDCGGMTPLSWAAYAGREAVVKILLKAGAEVNLKSQGNRSPLSWAAQKGQEAVVKLLLNMGAEVDQKDKYNWTPLLWAAKEGHEAAVTTLLSLGQAKVNLTDQKGRTPLSCAAKGGHEAVVTALLSLGQANVDIKDQKGRTPLWRAAKKGREATVKLLLNSGAQVDLKDHFNRTPLMWAAYCGYDAVVKLLLDAGTEVDSKDKFNQTSLVWAAENGHEAVVKLLLDSGAEIDFIGSRNQTPLMWAARGGHDAVVKLLLDKGAEVDSKNVDGQTPLSWAAQHGHAIVANILLNAGAEVDLKDKTGRTPLSQMAQVGQYSNEAAITILLNAGAKVDSKDQTNRTPLSWAAELHHKAMVKLLLNAGAEVDLKDQSGRTPLSWATGWWGEATVTLLLDMGADVNSKDRNGQTPLWRAVRSRSETMVELLLDRGEVDLSDDNGQKLLSWAAENGCEAVVRLLQACIPSPF